MVDVTRLIDSLLENFRQIGFALQIMAALSALAGFAGIFSILRARAFQRQSELHLLKVLGATDRPLRRALTREAFFLGLVASSLGALMSVAVGAGLSHWLFDTSPALPPLFWFIGIPLVFAVLAAIIQRLAIHQVLETNPQSWLRALVD